MASVPLQRRHLLFAGRVQGVGFRYTARNIALRYNVVGYVRNLPDGRVELVMEGAGKEMDEIVDELKQKMEGFLKSIQAEDEPPTGQYREFSIRH